MSDGSPRPLVVDLDGTLIPSDLLYETAFAELSRNPLSAASMFMALMQGRAALKDRLASRAEFDASLLPYDENVLSYLRQAKAQGRPIYLASASSEHLVSEVAKHLGVFDGWYASSKSENLSGKAKAKRLVEQFGEKGFDYIGNGKADLPIWRVCAKAISVRGSPSTSRNLRSQHTDVEVIATSGPGARDWLKLIRVFQYPKNLLVFVAAVTSHTFDPQSLVNALLAFLAFSATASAVYILNDLADLRSDRTHPTKKNRPLASGRIDPFSALLACVALIVIGFGLAAFISTKFLGVLGAYFVLTTAYSFYFKRKFLIDVVILSVLYTLRVVAGAVAINVATSEWLLMFSMFIFMSLALVKRYTELVNRLDSGQPDSSYRNYRVGDLPIVLAMSIAAGFNAVTVLALYAGSGAVRELYSRPEIIWLICPIMIYWIGRTIMLAHRREMNDDPVIFALSDKISIATVCLIGLIILVAI